MIRILQYLWATPNCSWALLLFPFYGVKWRTASWNAGALHVTCKRAIGMPGAQTLGYVMFFVGEGPRSREDGTLGVHEGQHVQQALRWGILRDVAYGAEWLFRLLFMPGQVPAWTIDPKSYDPAKYSPDQVARKIAKWRSRWWRAYWNLYWERDARRVAGQPVLGDSSI